MSGRGGAELSEATSTIGKHWSFPSCLIENPRLAKKTGVTSLRPRVVKRETRTPGFRPLE